MDHTQWLANFTSEYVVSLETLTVGKPHPTLHVKKQSTSSGWMTLLKLGQKADRDVYVILPDRSNDQFTTKVIDEINSKLIFCNLI